MTRQRVAVLGAGSVGLALAFRLRRGGHDVLLLTRLATDAARLRATGVSGEDPADGSVVEVGVDALPLDEMPAEAIPILVCTGRDDVAAAVARAASRSLAAPIAIFANDVGAEDAARAPGRIVIGGVWRETCTRVATGHVRLRHELPGRAILGLHPEGSHPEVERIAGILTAAGIRVGISTCIRQDKWLKLCVNLTSAPNALVRRDDHATRPFVELKARLLEEARDTLDAAGVVACSCDGADRSLDEEILHHRASLAAGTSARPIPLYNQVWSSLERGTALEADGYHTRIIDLAARHGVPTPANRRVLDLLRRVAAEGRGPECLSAAELLGGAQNA